MYLANPCSVSCSCNGPSTRANTASKESESSTGFDSTSSSDSGVRIAFFGIRGLEDFACNEDALQALAR